VDAMTVVTSVGAAMFGGGGIAAIVGAIARRRTIRADAAETLTDSALELVAALKADAAAARVDARAAAKDAASARREAAETHRQMVQVRQEAQLLAGRLRQLVRAIHQPDQTIERLRTLVPLAPETTETDF
jgi:hypothetical protein